MSRPPDLQQSSQEQIQQWPYILHLRISSEVLFGIMVDECIVLLSEAIQVSYSLWFQK